MDPFAFSGLILIITSSAFALVMLIFGREKFHKIYALTCMAVGLWGFGVFRIGTSPSPESAILGWKIGYTGVILIASLFYTTVLRYFHKKNNKIVFFAFIQAAAFIYFLIFSDKFFDKFILLRGNLAYALFTPLLFTSFLMWSYLVLLSHFEFFLYLKKCSHEKSDNKSNALIFALVTILGFGGGFTNFLPCFGLNFYPYGNYLLLAYQVLTAYSIFKRDLFNLQIIVKKSIVYSISVTFISLIYAIIIMLTSFLFQNLSGQQSFFINLIFVLIIGIAFSPLRNKIQEFLDKRFFQGTLESLAQEGERLRQELFHKEKLAYVGQLASSIAHEIRNPLTSIKTFLDYLPQKYNEPEFKAKFNELIPREINRIDKVVSQLLDLAKPKAAVLRPCNIINTIDSTLSLLDDNLKLKKINVKREFDSDEVVINGDDDQLRQVFLNLFLNALQAMGEGGVLTINVTLRSSVKTLMGTDAISDHQRYPSVIISVSDTGIGIPDSQLKKLFEPFQTTKPDGIGLGLSITQEIIKLHGGAISAESIIGKGAKFIINFSKK